MHLDEGSDGELPQPARVRGAANRDEGGQAEEVPGPAANQAFPHVEHHHQGRAHPQGPQGSHP